jgi:hypothetical protein
MTDDISKARQALRDYARTAHEIELSTQPGWVSAPVGAMVGVVRGEAAGKAFVAIQAALTVAEEMRAEGEEPVTTKVEIHGQLVPYPPDVHYRRAQRETANRIELAILKALS